MKQILADLLFGIALTTMFRPAAIAAELAAGLNIPNKIVTQGVAASFIIEVLQNSYETAFNSSTNVLFNATTCQADAIVRLVLYAIR